MRKTYYLYSSVKQHYLDFLYMACLNKDDYDFILITEESHRNKHNELNYLNLFKEVIVIKEFNFTKNIFKYIKNFFSLHKFLKNSIDFKNYIITYEPFSLQNLIILSLFSPERRICIISRKKISLNHKINFLKTIIYSLNTLPIGLGPYYYSNYNGTNLPVTSKNLKFEKLILCENYEIDKRIKFKKKIPLNFDFYRNKKVLSLFQDSKFNIKEKFNLILFDSSEIIKEEHIFIKLKKVINQKDIKHLVKDHPMSQFNDEELSIKFEINKSNIINKNILIEEFILCNLGGIEKILLFQPMSNVLNFSNKFNIPSYSFWELKKDYWIFFNDYYKNSNVNIFDGDQIENLEKKEIKKNNSNSWAKILSDD